MKPLNLLEQLMRQPGVFLARILRDPAVEAPDRRGDGMPIGLTEIARVLLLALVLSAGLFGAVLGSSRGGLQVLFCAVKLPLLLLVTLVVCTPPFITISRALGGGASLQARAIISLALGSCTRFALVLAGLAPLIWLAQGFVSYHTLIMTTVAACATAGLYAGTLLFRGLAESHAGTAGPDRSWPRLAGVAFVVVFALVGAHTSWLLRPFVVRPRTVAVPFVRALESDLFDSVTTSARSAAGLYSRACGGAPCE